MKESLLVFIVCILLVFADCQDNRENEQSEPFNNTSQDIELYQIGGEIVVVDEAVTVQETSEVAIGHKCHEETAVQQTPEADAISEISKEATEQEISEGVISQESKESASLKSQEVTVAEDEKLQNLEFSKAFEQAVLKNKEIAQKFVKNDATYFEKHVSGQTPQYMWIGCSDSRVIPEKILGLDIGEIFVTRNVANQANPLDQSVMAAVEYAVKHLKVKTLIVAGHYECGGVKASLSNHDYGHLESWLSQIRAIRYRHQAELSTLSEHDRLNRLIELNVEEQAKQLSYLPMIQHHWRGGHSLEIVGVVYDIKLGTLNSVIGPINGLEDIPDEQEFSAPTNEEH